MDSTKVLALLEHLDDEIEDLQESMVPLLQNTLAEIASKQPLLDRAKLYVFVTYAIESILFSYLQLNGVKAREHPVFGEILRVKQYFVKIKLAETGPVQRNLTLDKGAAARFIRAGLVGNDKIDLQRAEQQAKEVARSHMKFEDAQDTDRKRKLENGEHNNVVDTDANQEGHHNSEEKGRAHKVVKTSESVRQKSSKKSKEKRNKNSKNSKNSNAP